MTCYFFPPIFPDETIYSYLSRLHIYSAETNHRVTAQKRLAKFGMSIDQKLPLGLSYISEYTELPVEHLLLEHTFYPIFAAFCAKPQALRNAMISNEGRSIANLSNVSQAGLQPLSGHKYCPDCLEDDVSVYGVAYWHLEHQMTGVTCCLKHDIQLRIQKLKPRKFHLPPQQDVLSRRVASADEIKLSDLIIRYNRFCKPNSDESDEVYASDLMALLRSKHRTKGSYVDMESLMYELGRLSYALFDTAILSEHVTRNILHKKIYFCHPLKYIFLSYVVESMSFETASEPNKKLNLRDRPNEDRQRCIALLLQTDCSLREISRRVKRSVIFVKTIASQIGAYFQRRTQFITPDIIFRVTESAQIGEHRKQIAKRESISVGAVEQIIQSVPGLPEKRKLIRFDQRRSMARASIENAIESSPSITRGKIKKACGANYTWLYKHDSEWLYKTLPKALNYTKK